MIPESERKISSGFSKGRSGSGRTEEEEDAEEADRRAPGSKPHQEAVVVKAIGVSNHESKAKEKHAEGKLGRT